MSKPQKIILGVLTLSPLLFLGLYFYTFFGFVFQIAEIENGNFGEPSDVFPGQFFNLFIYMGLMMLVSIGLLIFYLIHISKNEKFKLPENNHSKLIWILIIIFAGFIGMIVYFILEIWPEKKERLIIEYNDT